MNENQLFAFIMTDTKEKHRTSSNVSLIYKHSASGICKICLIYKGAWWATQFQTLKKYATVIKILNQNHADVQYLHLKFSACQS